MDDMLAIAALAKGGKGGCSWNDLEDKPFYEECSRNVIIPEQVLSFDEAYPKLGYCSVDVGMVVNIDVDGVVYTSDVVDGRFNGDSGYKIAWLPINDSNSCKIVFNMSDDNNGELAGIDPHGVLSGNHTISVYTEETVIKQLDPKFIPESTGGGGMFVEVIFDKTDNVWTCNLSYAELDELIMSGKMLIGRKSFNGTVNYYSSPLYYTSRSYNDNEMIYFKDFGSEKTWTVYDYGTVIEG